MGEALLASVYVQALQLDQQTVQWNPLSSGYTQLSLYSVPQPPRSYRVVGLNITENTVSSNTKTLLPY